MCSVVPCLLRSRIFFESHEFTKSVLYKSSYLLKYNIKVTSSSGEYEKFSIAHQMVFCEKENSFSIEFLRLVSSKTCFKILFLFHFFLIIQLLLFYFLLIFQLFLLIIQSFLLIFPPFLLIFLLIFFLSLNNEVLHFFLELQLLCVLKSSMIMSLFFSKENE